VVSGATIVVSLSGHRGDPEFADVVYVGRALYRGGWRLAASPLACPYRPGRDGTRADVVSRYREYLLGRPDLLALLPELRGKRIGCWCAPLLCHADVIAELADAEVGADADAEVGAGRAAGSVSAGQSGDGDAPGSGAYRTL
jgi:Domain of unknown function (DUF4326)